MGIIGLLLIVLWNGYDPARLTPPRLATNTQSDRRAQPRHASLPAAGGPAVCAVSACGDCGRVCVRGNVGRFAGGLAVMPEWLVSVILALIGSGAVGVWFERRLRAAETKRTQAESEKIEAEEAQTYAAISAAQNSEWQKLHDLQATRVEALEVTIKHELNRSANRETELLNQIASLRADVSNLQNVHSENMTLKEENVTLRKQVRELRVEVGILKAVDIEKTAQISALMLEMEALRKRIAELERKGETGPLKGGTETAGR